VDSALELGRRSGRTPAFGRRDLGRIDWTLRPATAADDAFLLRVYAGTRADELALTGWDEARCQAFVTMQYRAQAAHYRVHWPDAEQSVIELRDAHEVVHDVGRLWLHRRPDALHLLDVALLPAWRERGVGSALLLALMDEAASRGRGLTIYVENGNPARRLYDRLGFRPEGLSAGGIHQFMRWRRETLATTETADEQA